MRSTKKAKARRLQPKRHLALTIALSQDEFSFIDECVELKEFRSVDELFGAALAFYRRHLEAINKYADDQFAEGHSRAEVLESIEFETFITKAVVRPNRSRGKR